MIAYSARESGDKQGRSPATLNKYFQEQLFIKEKVLDPLFNKYSALGRVTEMGSSNAEDDKKFIDFIFHLKDQGQIYEEE